MCGAIILTNFHLLHDAKYLIRATLASKVEGSNSGRIDSVLAHFACHAHIAVIQNIWTELLVVIVLDCDTQNMRLLHLFQNMLQILFKFQKELRQYKMPLKYTGLWGVVCRKKKVGIYKMSHFSHFSIFRQKEKHLFLVNSVLFSGLVYSQIIHD